MPRRRKVWRKLYREETGTFAQLPFYTRACAAELLKAADEKGRIPLGGRTPVDAIAFMMGATKGDRRLLRRDLVALADDGYLAIDDEAIRINNFERFQATSTSATADSETVANRPRTGHEPSTNGRRTGDERETKPEINPRNHTTGGASSEPERAPQRKKKRENPPYPPGGSGGGVDSSGPDPLDGELTSAKLARAFEVCMLASTDGSNLGLATSQQQMRLGSWLSQLRVRFPGEDETPIKRYVVREMSTFAQRVNKGEIQVRRDALSAFLSYAGKLQTARRSA